MGIRVTVDLKGIEKEVNDKIMNGINESLEFLKDYAMKESPIKTGEYNNNHEITEAEENGKAFSGMLENKTPYAQILEYGVMSRTYNYHRYGKVYMSGVGARVYTRTQDNNLMNIERIIKKNLSIK